MSDRSRFVGLYATIAAAASCLAAPLLALSYFAIPAGAEELETGTVAAWAEPARDVADGLVTFASADRVYATYTQAFALLFPAVLLCAWLTRAARTQPPRRGERWGWRLTLTGYSLFAVGLAAIAVMLVGASASSGLLDLAFLPLVVPGILLSTIGSTVLGIALLRDGFQPRVSAWLLALAFPLWIVGSFVLGHNSLGLVPLLLAWGATGWPLWRAGGHVRHTPALPARQA